MLPDLPELREPGGLQALQEPLAPLAHKVSQVLLVLPAPRDLPEPLVIRDRRGLSEPLGLPALPELPEPQALREPLALREPPELQEPLELPEKHKP